MTTDPLSRARALLEAAAPGEWVADDVGCVTVGDWQVAGVADRDHRRRPNAALIAAAPALLAALCDELEKAREVVEAMKVLRECEALAEASDWPSDEEEERRLDALCAAGAALASALARYDAARRGEAG